MLRNNIQNHRTAAGGKAPAGRVLRGCYRGDKKKGIGITADCNSYRWKTRKCLEIVAKTIGRQPAAGHGQGECSVDAIVGIEEKT